MPILSPSILSANVGNLSAELAMLKNSAAEWIHIDVMDGCFVPNISFGFPIVEFVHQESDMVADVHLMIVEPERYIPRFAKAGADIITFHIEATDDPQRCIDMIHESGAKAGLSIKPATPVSAVEPYLKSLDMVLIMSVEPGFGGQSFIDKSLNRVAELRELIATTGKEILIEVDGGISSANSRAVFDAGADVVVAGNAVFKAENPMEEIHKIVNL